MSRKLLSAVLILSAMTFIQAKIGFVSADRVFMETEEGKKEAGKIRAWAEEQQGVLNGLKTQFNEKQQQMQTQRNILSEEKIQELTVELEGLTTRIKRMEEDLQREYEKRMMDFGRAMEKKLSPLFLKYAKDNQYELVLYLNQQSLSQVIAYYSEEQDITEALIQIFNQTYPAGN
jgi:Skp family chaperone for outer membrane proteins